MIIQNTVRLDELDNVQHIFKSQESWLYLLFKLRVYVVGFSQFFISVLPFMKFIELNYIVVT